MQNHKASFSSKKISFKKKIFLIIKYISIFILVPIIGTITHEFGHFMVAIINGYNARIAYAYTISTIDSVKEPDMYFYYILGGPVATWIQSLIPFSIMVFYYDAERRNNIRDDLPLFYTILLCFTSICGRFIFNAGGFIIFRSKGADEYKIERHLGLIPGTVILTFAFLALVILFYSIYLIPKKFRIPLFFGAIIGALIGYIIWYYWLGPILMPIGAIN